MKLLIVLSALLSMSIAKADEKIEFFFKTKNLGLIVEKYSLATGQKFVVDIGYLPGVASILVHEPITKREAFNHLSSALAVNGYAIAKKGDVMIIKSARMIQRDLIEVSTEIPSLQPERMYTWIYQFKNVRATDIKRDLRLVSKDGEYFINTSTNQIVFTDWVSNIIKISEIFKLLDKPLDPVVSEILKKPATDTSERKTKDFPN